MITVILNPYDLFLYLSDKDDKKLFSEACKGIKDDDLFDGKKEKYNDFVELIKKLFEVVRVREFLKVPVKWYKDNLDIVLKRDVTEVINLFDRNAT